VPTFAKPFREAVLVRPQWADELAGHWLCFGVVRKVRFFIRCFVYYSMPKSSCIVGSVLHLLIDFNPPPPPPPYPSNNTLSIIACI
jgi:hypothetical protein